MIIDLDLQSEIPIYTQLVQTIKKGIALKELVPGEALPSVRSLAADLGINLHTVNKAYQLLKQEGYVFIHRQKGVVINPEGVPKADEVYVEKLKGDLEPLIVDAICRDMDEERFIQLCREQFKKFR
ncbi:GntR family transcriptional regulator [Fictibacillus sp. Mic-4]|uniref:GntR family transcriptional regulator n=1 Tax=Fictibacillus TaxID=1329200 RepID=UPI0003FA788A|nr:GntR family transcriptional regulator [Fictibacillus gelatini]